MSAGNVERAAAKADRVAAAHRALREDASIQFVLTRAAAARAASVASRAGPLAGRGVRAGRTVTSLDRQLHARRPLCADRPVDGHRARRRGAARHDLSPDPGRRVEASSAPAPRAGCGDRAEQRRSGRPRPRRRAPGWARPMRWPREGRYAEAVHHLLFRSIEDIGGRRPRLVRPALTSRELAAAAGVPPPARACSRGSPAGSSAACSAVGRSRAATGRAARPAYADLVLPGTWRAMSDLAIGARAGSDGAFRPAPSC